MGSGLAGHPVCTFALGDALLAAPLDRVREVVRPAVLTPVPLAPDAVVGLHVLRGRILPAVDLGPRFGGPATAVVAVVVETARGPVSLLADRAGDVVALAPGDLAPPPEGLEGLIRGIGRAGGVDVLVLDPDRALP